MAKRIIGWTIFSVSFCAFLFITNYFQPDTSGALAGGLLGLFFASGMIVGIVMVMKGDNRCLLFVFVARNICW